MKKKILTVMVVAVLAIASLALIACGGDKTPTTTAGMNVKEAKSQIDALMEVKAKTADAAIIDATMAGYLLKSDGSFADLQIVNLDGVDFAKEYYGVAAKKGNDALIAFINDGIKKAQESGKYDELLKKYGLEDRANSIKDKTFTVPANWKDSLGVDKDGNKIVVVGYTANAPMGIVKDNKVSGFDIELAEAIFAPENVKVVPKLIEWDNKETELQGNTIDLVWNGLTVTPEREEAMCISAYYMFNAQAIVINSAYADDFKAMSDLNGMKVVVEAGSAGAENAELINAKLTK